MAETLGPGDTVSPTPASGKDADRYACLIVALDAGHPLEPPVRHWLIDLDEVSIGRSAEARVCTRVDHEAGGRMRLRLPDGQVSGRHALIRREGTRWLIEDRNSSNGTYVDGKAVSRAPLEHGNVIMVGRTFLIYREAVLPARPEKLDLRANDRDFLELPLGLRTLSPLLELELRKLRTVATSKSAVVITGESGTGKELLAAAVHELSGRKGPLIVVQCGALPSNTVESELFGHKKGAFTGAIADKQGLVTASDHGTLFLDEIGELTLSTQAALLRTLQDGEVRPIGATAVERVDLRLVSATHRDLRQMVAAGDFRADLWARIKAFQVSPPPLRERPEDLGLILGELLQRYAKKPARPSLTRAAAASLFAHSWPLNIRELEKAVEPAVALAAGGEIDVSHWPSDLVAPEPELSDDEKLRRRVVALLQKHRGVLAQVGRAMDKDRVQIQKWCKRLGIDPDLYRDRPHRPVAPEPEPEPEPEPD